MIYKHKIITLMTIFSFMSVGWGQDTTPPELTFFTFSPDTVNLNQRNPVEFIFEGIDDISGIKVMGLCLEHNNYQNIKCTSETYEPTQLEVSSSVYITFGENDPEGIWSVYSFYFYDDVDNQTSYSDDDLEQMGFPNEIFVTYQEPLENQLGDLTQDSQINVQDIIVLIDIIIDVFDNDYIPTDEELQLGDIYPDGQLNVIDIVGLVNIILDI